jgi:DNA-binding beta-propeller fold protein YncE
VLAVAQSNAQKPSAVPGKLDDGTVLLPNGWRIAPAGKHVSVGTLPLNIVVTLDGRYAIVATAGLMKPALSVIEVATWTVKNTYQLENVWYGLALSPDGTKVYVGGCGQNNVQEFTFADGVLTKARTLALPAQTGETFAGGVAISKDGRTLFVTRVFAMTLSAIDLGTGSGCIAVALATRRAGAEIHAIDLSGSPDEQAAQVRDAIRLLFPEAVTLVREAREGLA